MNESANRDLIRELNDEFRQSFEGGRVLMTPGVQALAADTVGKALRAIKEYDNFTPENDPYSEHDFGEVEVDEQKIWWKMDYFDRELQFGSANAADPDITTRVMTILLPSEY